MSQRKMVTQNRKAWEADAYASWVKAYGLPEKAAAELIKNPTHKARRILPYLGDIKSKRIANPLGSHGRLGVALALLGAEVTVFDISESNQKYALELAHNAGVNLGYVLGDFLSIDLSLFSATFDAVVLELGILHYFFELDDFVSQVNALLVTNGCLVINEFHPLMKKVVREQEGIASFTGDYFFSEPESVPVAYESFSAKSSALPGCLVRR